MGEQEDLAAAHPERVERLLATLEAWSGSGGDPLIGRISK